MHQNNLKIKIKKILKKNLILLKKHNNIAKTNPLQVPIIK